MKKAETNKLDKMWRDKIHTRDTFCQVCGNNGMINAHHIIGRRNHSLRWVLDNGIGLCPGCHTFRTQSAHQDPMFFMEWFKDEYPERYENISTLRQQVNKQPFDFWVDNMENNTYS